jgi:hypothetical protein
MVARLFLCDNKRMRRSSTLFLAGLMAVATRAEEELEEELKLSFWDKSINLRGGFGYKDNVLLSTVNREGSAFWLSAVDFAVLRASLDGGPQVTFFASGEDRRYFSSSALDKEQLLLAQARVTQDVSYDWAFGGLVQYLYADQVFDASATEQLFETLPVKSHNLQIAPIIKRSLPWNSELELRLSAERQFFNEPLDDYWEAGPELTWTRNYGNRSSASLSYTYDHRMYDTRLPLSLEREPIGEGNLQLSQHEFEFALNHSWDKERHWRTRVKALVEFNDDNGAGFYDYTRYRLSGRIGYWGSDWHATLEGRLLHYDYERQPIFNGTAVRQVWEYVAAFHIEKTIWKKLKVFADNEFETVRSNYAFEEYKVNTVLAGVDWEF